MLRVRLMYGHMQHYERERERKRQLCCQFRTGFFLGIFFNPEDGGHMSLRNVGCLSTDYTASYTRSQNYSKDSEF
jgi:hypothetical protein